MNITFALQPICHVDNGNPTFLRMVIEGTPTVADVIADILKYGNHGKIKIYRENCDLYVSSMRYKNNVLSECVNTVYDDAIVTGGRATVWQENDIDYTLCIK